MEKKILISLCAFSVLGGIAPSAVAFTENTSSQFLDIPKKNVFRLREPAPAVQPATPPQVPKLLLTGITTILGNKRALLKQLPVDAKAADPVNGLSLMLTEGQREGDVEVLEIDEKNGKVRVNNSGTLMTLTFERDGPKLPSTAVPAGVPGAPALPGTGPATAARSRMGVMPPMPTGYTNVNVNTFPMPTRSPRLPVQGTTEQSTAQPNNNVPTSVPSMTGYGPTPVGLSGTGDASVNQFVEPELTPEQLRVLRDVERVSRSRANVPSGGSGTFTTPVQEGIWPAFVPQPPASSAAMPRP